MRQKYRWLRPPNRALAVTFALQSGPVFDDSMVRQSLLRESWIRSSWLISDVFANESE